MWGTHSPRNATLRRASRDQLVLHCSRPQPLTVIHQHEILETMAQRCGWAQARPCWAPIRREIHHRRRRRPGRLRVCSRKPSSNYSRRLYFFVSDLQQTAHIRFTRIPLRWIVYRWYAERKNAYALCICVLKVWKEVLYLASCQIIVSEIKNL